MNKKEYVEKHLKMLVLATDFNIVDVKYIDNSFGQNEQVKICYENGYTAFVNVTGNSNVATAQAVLGYIAAH